MSADDYTLVVPTVLGESAGYLDVKRLHLPGIKIQATCPHCKEVLTKDMARDYFSYPVLGQPEKFSFACAEDHQLYCFVTLNLTVAVAEEAPSP